MTLSKFNKLLKLINPKLHIKQRGYGDIGGVYAGSRGYIARVTKGELTMNGYRVAVVDPLHPMLMKQGRIQKRGRKTLINLLRNYRWIPKHEHRTMLTWGIIPAKYGN